jgi:hypothetical protein
MKNIKEFTRIAKGLNNHKVPCTMKLEADGEVNIVIGRDAPQKYLEQLDDALEALKVNWRDICVCGDLACSSIVKTERVYGGAKNW